MENLEKAFYHLLQNLQTVSPEAKPAIRQIEVLLQGAFNEAGEEKNHDAAKVYIAGPMTGKKDWNFPAFNRAEKILKEIGFNAVNPAKLADHTDRPWEWYMRNSLKAMLDCDTICLLRGWEKSRGAKLELLIATRLGFGVFMEDGEGNFQVMPQKQVEWLKAAL